jgi:hypothetical protein
MEDEWIRRLEEAILDDPHLCLRHVQFGLVRDTSWSFYFDPCDENFPRQVARFIREDIPENIKFTIVGVDVDDARYMFHLYVSCPNINMQTS